MTQSTRIVLVGLVGVALVALTACGGGGQGLRVVNDPLVVTSTSIPPLASGEQVNHVIPLQGGCGGPYVMQVIEGEMPEGCFLDEATHAIRGYALESGTFPFVVQITDSGCVPFQTTTAPFTMSITVGGLTVIQALQDGVPGMIRPGDAAYADYAGDPRGEYPAIPAVVYGNFSTIDLLVAGGLPPYEAAVFDDPANPFDGPLPNGPIIPEGSTSITGKAQEVGPAGGPFLVTVQVRDAAGSTTLFTFYWLIRTPPIVIATESLLDGKCGTLYNDTFFIVDGVPPFVHEFAEDGPGLDADGKSLVYDQVQAPDSGDVVYEPPNAPQVPTPGHLVRITDADYPVPPSDDAGGTLDYGAHGIVAPPEGIRLNEETGLLSGFPRREGTFRVHYHVRSAGIPNNFGQQNWATFEFSFAPSDPVVQDGSYTLPGSFQGPPYSLIPEAEEGQAYDPDGGLAGLQLKAFSGVWKDGWTDAPHVSQTSSIVGDTSDKEQVGAYDWAIEWNPTADPVAKDPIPGMALDGWIGSFRVANVALLVKQPPQAISFTVSDQQLPFPNTRTESVRFGVGPDTILITQSSTSCSGTSTGVYSLNDTNMTVRVMEAGTTVRPPRNLVAGDLTHALPSAFGTTDPATLLSGIDVTRVSVNPTGWWDDVHFANPKGARPFQHGDSNRYYTYYGINYIYYYYYSTDTSYYEGFPDVTAVRLPSAPTVTPNLATGVYANGGKLYVFDAKDYFGVFIVRRNSKIYVPVAFKKGTYYSFGDNWTYDWNASPSRSTLNKLPQMTVSPDGRFAAMKIRKDKTLNQFERAGTTDIVIFSLTGEKAFGTNTYKVITSGSNGSSSYGEILFASSLTLTNEYLYYLVGNDPVYGWAPSVSSGSTYTYYYWYAYYQGWNNFYIYRYGLASGLSAGTLMPGPSSTDANWKNTPGTPMQLSFQKYTPFTRTSYNMPELNLIQCSGNNAAEHGLAAHPFRVSADGKNCAILASPYQSSPTSTAATVLLHHVWVDRSGVTTRISTTARRHPHAGGRGYQLRDSPPYYGYGYTYTGSGYIYDYYYVYQYHYGNWTGPTTAFEISDDGTKVAAVYFDYTGSMSTTGSSTWAIYPEHVVAFENTTGSTWVEREVTKGIFSSSITWRFGALVFTKDNQGFVFYGSQSGYAPSVTTSTWYYARGAWQVGSLYGYDFSKTGEVWGLVDSSVGGAAGGIWAVYTSSSQNAGAGQYGRQSGCLQPVGGFLSANREFFYLVNHGAVVTTGSDHELIGVNVRRTNPTKSTSAANSVNGHPDFQAFRVAGMPTRRGFLPTYSTTSTAYYYAMYGIGGYSSILYYDYGAYAPGGSQGAGLQVCATDAGWIFFASHYQAYGPASNATTSYYSYGVTLNSTYQYDMGLYGGHLHVFDPNVGGAIQNLTDSLWPLTDSTTRPITFVEPADDGRQVGFVYRTSQVFNAERLGFVGNIQLDPTTGNLVSTEVFSTLLASNQRVAPTMTHYLYGSHLFTAYAASDENQATIYRFTPASGSTGETALTSSSSKARYNVLNAAR